MVAMTPAYGLPYQEATDAPCDAPEVWCDFVALANTAMGTTKSTLDRVEPAVPACLVEQSEDIEVTLGETVMIPFNSVIIDTDGMVNTDQSNVFVFPQRMGLYHVVANVSYTNTTAPTDEYIAIFIVTSYTDFPVPFDAGLGYTSIASDSVAILPINFSNHLRSSATELVDETFLDMSSTNAGGFGIAITAPISGTMNLTRVQLGVYYLRETP